MYVRASVCTFVCSWVWVVVCGLRFQIRPRPVARQRSKAHRGGWQQYLLRRVARQHSRVYRGGWHARGPLDLLQCCRCSIGPLWISCSVAGAPSALSGPPAVLQVLLRPSLDLLQCCRCSFGPRCFIIVSCCREWDTMFSFSFRVVVSVSLVFTHVIFYILICLLRSLVHPPTCTLMCVMHRTRGKCIIHEFSLVPLLPNSRQGSCRTRGNQIYIKLIS